MSREHYFSRSLLQELKGSDGLVQVTGLAHQARGHMQALTPDNLAANVLCRSCNAALSSLDGLSSQVFRHLRDAKPGGVLILNGHDLERWMLKLLCGLAASGSTSHFRAGVLRGWTPPREWLDTLFRGAALTGTAGIYAFEGLATQDVSCGPFGDGGSGRIYGAELRLFGVTWILAAGQVSTKTGRLKSAAFRPVGVARADPGGARHVVFGWNARSGSTPTLVTITPEPSLQSIAVSGRIGH